MMKPHSAILTFAFLIFNFAFAQAANVIVTITDYQDQPLTNTRCIATCYSVPSAQVGSVSVIAKNSFYTDVTGAFTITNAIAGNWQVVPQTNNAAAFAFTVPVTNGTLRAENLLSVATNGPLLLAWTTAADARYDALGSASNALAISNNYNGTFNGTVTGSASTAGTAGIVTNFFSHNFITIGDSLTTTNPSTFISYPMILGYMGNNVLTNSALGGQSSSAIAGPLLDNTYSYQPIISQIQSVTVLCMGQNDLGGADGIIATNQANAIALMLVVSNQMEYAVEKVTSMGGRVIFLTLPYNPNQNTNREYCRQLLRTNAFWMAANTPGVAGTLDFDSVAPPTIWTNSNGSINTNTTADGTHPTSTIDTNLVNALIGVVMHSAANTNSQAFPNTSLSPYDQTNTGVHIMSMTGTTAPKIHMQGSLDASEGLVEESLNGDTGSNYTAGVSLFSPRDGTGGIDWGFRFWPFARTAPTLFVDTSAGSTIFNPQSTGGWGNNQLVLDHTIEIIKPVSQDIFAGGDGSNIHFENNSGILKIFGANEYDFSGGNVGVMTNQWAHAFISLPSAQDMFAGGDGSNWHLENNSGTLKLIGPVEFDFSTTGGVLGVMTNQWSHAMIFLPSSQDIFPGGDGNNVHVENNITGSGFFTLIGPTWQFRFGDNTYGPITNNQPSITLSGTFNTRSNNFVLTAATNGMNPGDFRTINSNGIPVFVWIQSGGTLLFTNVWH